MSVHQEIPSRLVLDRLADESGLAIAIVDASLIETSASNNNSICRTLNPDGEITGRCADFCGKALEKATEAGKSVGFVCHAGLDCRAVAMTSDERPVAAIVGRTFIKSENYRLATERAMKGDWQQHSPAELFENVLLSGSNAQIEKTMEKLVDLAVTIETVEAEREIAVDTPIKKPVLAFEQTKDEIARLAEELNERTERPRFPDAEQYIGRIAEPNAEAIDEPAAKTDVEPISAPTDERVSDAAAWRSFFGSLLSKDYQPACDAILQFLASHYGFRSLVWLERRDSRFEDLTGYGTLAGRKVKLGIALDDPRLPEAVASEMPVELVERSKNAEQSRIMYLFPVPVGGDIPSALAVLDPIEDKAKKHQIARLCHSVAPQLEILRLRAEVSRRDSLARAVRKFSDTLKTDNTDDFWLHLTLTSAELLQSERASLLVLDEKSGQLELKAVVGAHLDTSSNAEPGDRVSRIVFEKGKPAVVADVSATGLLPAPDERQYKTSSFISSPVTLGDRNIAVINFTDKVSGANFDKRDLELIRAITPQIAVAIDRAGLQERAGEFEQLAVTDALTGLLNRRYIEERLLEEVKRSNRHGYPMSFLMLDVDHFKSYNDSFGHPAGDEALKLVASVIRDTLRGADVAARFGGEEFAILLPQTTDDEASMIAERIRSNIEQSQFEHRAVTVSIGVASCSSDLCSVPGLIKAADLALYDAKHKGRNRVRLFVEMDASSDEPRPE